MAATALLADRELSEPQLFEAPGLTLEDVVLGVWEDLGAGRGPECLVCGRPGTTPGGHCAGCGSELD